MFSKRNMSRKKLIISIMLLLLSTVIVTGVVLAYQFKTKVDKMIIPKYIETELESDPDRHEIDGVSQTIQDSKSDFYILVMGLDYREGHGGLLTDTLMALHMIPEESIIKLLSIPRDLQVEDKSGTMVRINSLFFEGYQLTRQQGLDNPSLLTGDIVQLGSRKLDKSELAGAMANTRKKVEQLMDIKIDYSVLINFNTLIALVDEVGGIEIDVKRTMRYKETNLYLEPGLQILHGEEALGYARYREDDRGQRYFISDFQRGQHQQEVVRALADKILSWGNATQALNLLDIISDNVKTDMDYADMYTMITNYYGKFDSDSFISIQFPEYYNSEGKVVIPDEALEKLRESFQSLIDIEME